MQMEIIEEDYDIGEKICYLPWLLKRHVDEMNQIVNFLVKILKL